MTRKRKYTGRALDGSEPLNDGPEARRPDGAVKTITLESRERDRGVYMTVTFRDGHVSTFAVDLLQAEALANAMIRARDRAAYGRVGFDTITIDQRGN